MSSNKNSTKNNMNSNSKPGVSAISDSRHNRRSSRIQNTEDSSKKETSQTRTYKKSSKVHTKQHNVHGKCAENNKKSVPGELEAVFDQSDEEDSFVSNGTNSLVSSRLTEDDSQEDVKPDISNTYIATSSSFQPEDVSKVFKILSQPNTLYNASDSKPKPSLKTYSNHRKSANKSNIVESFGLPDIPMVSERPLVDNVLDAEILDASEITILDIKCIDDRWDIPNLNQHDFSHLEEIRVKSDPQKHFKIRHPSGNLEDIHNSDFIFTSTPQIKPRRLPKSDVSSVNRSSDKEVNIDTLKSNIRKLLRKTPSETSPKKTPSDTSHKRGRTSSRIFIQNGDISLEDSEIEIFSTPGVSARSNNATSVKTNSVSISKSGKSRNIHKPEEPEVASQRRRNLRSSGRSQESTPNNARKSSVSEESPKNTDNIPRTRLSSDKRVCIEEEVVKILTRSRSSATENQKRNRKKLSSVEHHLGTKLELDNDIITTPRRILRSKSSLDISLDGKSNKANLVKKLPVQKTTSSLRSRLRSRSQENVRTLASKQEMIINQRKTRSSLNISSFNKNTMSCHGLTPRNNSESSSKIKENVKSNVFPQLKVLLSPLKPFLTNNKPPQCDTPRKDHNTIRKSLRSFKGASEISVKSHIDAKKLSSAEDTSTEKLIFTEINTIAESSNPPLHSIIGKATPTDSYSESDPTPVLSKRIRQRIPQIFEDGSSSSESADIDCNNHSETLHIFAPPEKVVETDENSVGLFTDNFSAKTPDEFQQNEIDILNNLGEPPLEAEDDTNDAETTVEQPEDFEEVSDASGRTKLIPDKLPEKDSPKQTNSLLVFDVKPDSSSEPSSSEIFGASDELRTAESVQAITEAHKDKADYPKHRKLSKKSEDTKTIVPTEIIPITPDLSPTDNLTVSASQSSTSLISEASTTNLEGSPSKSSSIAEGESLSPLAGISNVGINSNKDETDKTVCVLDKIEATPEVIENVTSEIYSNRDKTDNSISVPTPGVLENVTSKINSNKDKTDNTVSVPTSGIFESITSEINSNKNETANTVSVLEKIEPTSVGLENVTSETNSNKDETDTTVSVLDKIEPTSVVHESATSEININKDKTDNTVSVLKKIEPTTEIFLEDITSQINSNKDKTGNIVTVLDKIEPTLVVLENVTSEINSNKDGTDNTVTVLDKIEHTSVVLEDVISKNSNMDTTENTVTVLDKIESTSVVLENVTSEINSNKDIADNTVSELGKIGPTSVVVLENDTSEINSDKDDTENTVSVLHKIEPTSEAVPENNTSEINSNKGITDNSVYELGQIGPTSAVVLENDTSEIYSNKDNTVSVLHTIEPTSEVVLENITSEINSNKNITDNTVSDSSSTSTSPVSHNLRKTKPRKIKKKVGSHKPRNWSSSYKQRNIKLTLPSLSSGTRIALASSKRIGSSAPLQKNSECSEMSDPSNLHNGDTIESSVEAQIAGTSTNESLGDQPVMRKRGRPLKMWPEKPEKIPLPKLRSNGDILRNEIAHTSGQVNVRKRGRPWKVWPEKPEIPLPKLRSNGEILENKNEAAQTSGQVNVRKLGRPRKVRKPETSPKPQQPGMSKEVAKLLDFESTILFNSKLVDSQTTCDKPVQSMDGSASLDLQDVTLVSGKESLSIPSTSSFNGASNSSTNRTQLFLENVFDSQNTIADHVKKRTREVKSYKLSGTSRQSEGSMKSNSFEVPFEPNSSLRSWKSLDFSEDTMPKDFEFLDVPKTAAVANKTAENELTELPFPSSTPKVNGDITTPTLLEGSKRGRGRPRLHSLVKKLPKLEDEQVTAGPSSLFSNGDGTNKPFLRSWLNQSLPCEEPELSDIENEMENRVENLAEPISIDDDSLGVVKPVPRSKTSLGGRIMGSDIEFSPRPRGRPRRKSLDQEVSVADEAEGDAKWKKGFSISAASRFSRNMKNVEPENLTDIKGDLLKFKVGSIAWAQIGSFPYWPCLITKEHGSGLFMKNVSTKNVPRTLYHVRFFGDNGRRAWISKFKMMVYTSSEDLENIYNGTSFSIKWPDTQLYYVKTAYQKRWKCAVNEAEQVKSMTLKERLQFFEDAANTAARADSNTPEDPNKTLDSPAKKKTKMPKPEPVSIIIDDDNVDKTAETSARRKFKTPKLIDQSHRAEQESKASTLELPLPKQEEEEESKADPFLLEAAYGSAKTSDDASEVESKTSVDSLAIFSSHSLDAQKALFKRNTLFKGVSKEKVCQFCFKAGDVLKCRGGCNGVYHVGCAVRVLQEKVPRGKRRRLSNKTEVALEENEIKEEPLEKEEFVEKVEPIEKGEPIENEEVDEKCGLAEKDKEHDAILLDDDDHVQIITVPSSVYNTPPRKTFPPNFANLTLAEQIDYKMKEIMRKFESKTTYSEPPMDARAAEEVLGVQPLSRSRNFDRGRALFPPAARETCAPQAGLTERQRILPQPPQPPNAVRCLAEPAKAVRHVTADSTLDQTSSSEAEEPPEGASAPPRSSGDDSGSSRDMRATASSPGVEEAKHVTADCDTLDVLQSENSNSNSSRLSKQSDTSEGAEGAKFVNPKHFKCGFCTENMDPYCFVCHRPVSKKGSNIRQKCALYQCGRYYHPECLKQWPQTQWSLIQTTKHRDSQEETDSFVCPQHVCHTCASDDPRAATSRCSGDKIVKCQRCPSTYHSTNLCVPAGSDVLSSTQIVCPRHRDSSRAYTINTTWCFLCSEGGNLVCCDTCPTSVHPECLPVNLTDDDKFICEECESGRMPLYDEIVWVKLGKYRWWPGLVLFPNEVPPNVMNIKHSRGEFVVKFFGTYDHYWVNRGRSFLFQEGDAGDTAVVVKKKVEAAFKRAVEEAVVVHKLKKEFKLTLEAESQNSQKPPPYIKIKVNKPVGNVRQMELDLSNTTSCECDPSQAHPCGPDSDCLNRLLWTECNPEVCPAGKRCNNQCFEKREYPPMVPYKTQSRGWGLKALAPIKKGQFVVEYVGEIIDDEEYQRRIQKMHEQKEDNYYFLTIDKDRMIDAGPKGNVARFMNHCCQPNCETQKWTVNGDTRVGLFAAQDIPADTELTFNYNLECIGKEKKICRCGAPNCSGFIGVKAKQETEMKRPKKTYKKKQPVKPLALPPCFICGRKGNVGACNNKICNKAYHLRCLKMTEWPESNKFVCPWHNCKICSKRTIRCCVKCVNSYCPSHSEGNVRYDNLLGFVCTSHDPSKSENERVPVRKKRPNVITEESAVTSTTSDDFEGDEDDRPLSHRSCRRKKTRKAAPADSGSEEFSLDHPSTSTPLGKTHHEPHRSQDETVSSATSSDAAKRKRRRRRHSRKIGPLRKRVRLGNVRNRSGTAATARDTNVNSKTTRLEVDDR